MSHRSSWREFTPPYAQQLHDEIRAPAPAVLAEIAVLVAYQNRDRFAAGVVEDLDFRVLPLRGSTENRVGQIRDQGGGEERDPEAQG